MSTFGAGSYGAPPPLPIAAPAFAGFWIRVVAYLIDGVLLNIVMWALFMASGQQMMNVDPVTGMPAIAWGLMLGSIVVPAVYVVGFWLNSGATPGKMLFGLRIVDAATGQPLTGGQAVGRFFAYFVSSFVLCLGFLWVAFDIRKQGWHDKLASTVVIRR